MEMLSFAGQYYLDDRMFVVDVEAVAPTGVVVDEGHERWAVTTRRNVPGYAVFRRRLFDTRDEAIAVLRAVAPQTPRLSLRGLSPIPAPTYEQHNQWLREHGLAPLAY
jgi:hypothetical protein